MRGEMDGLEKERDFYFEKLRDIEVLMQELEDKGQGTELSAAVFKILYATGVCVCVVTWGCMRLFILLFLL